MMGRPQFDGDCLGCYRCVSICPGLAITLVDKGYDKTKETARVIIPWELPNGAIKLGKKVTTTGLEGEIIGKGSVIAIKESEWQDRRRLVSLEVPYKEVDLVAGIRLKKPLIKKTISKAIKAPSDREVVICRCERVTKKEVVDYIKKTGTKDINAVKAALRIGMGPCGGKTCTELVLRIFRELGIDIKDVEPPVDRPFTQEVPLKAFFKEEDK
jgi:ferredoxin